MNVDDGKKNRASLKSYFVKNAIPTEGQFSQFIDSVLNQRDDGLVKNAGDPLSIEAAGDDSSFKKAINFYTHFADSDPAWSVCLRPRANPADPQTGRAGLSINDAAGNSRLCIDLATGNVGIGTVAPDPANKLQVEGPLHMDGNPIFLRPSGSDQFGVIRSNAQADRLDIAGFNGVNLGFTGGGATPVTQPVLSVSNAGNVGIGTAAPDPKNKLQVEGPLHMNGNPIFLRQGPTDQFDVLRWNAQMDRIDIAGFNGVNLGFTNGGTTAVMKPALSIGADGHVGIGTTSPTETLEVAGRVKAGPLLIGPWPANAAGYVCFAAGSLNQAVPGNYALLQDISTGESFLNSPSRIRFRLNNNDQMMLATNGFFGIGTTTPSQKLDVNGSFIRVSGAGNESVYMGGDGAGNDAQFGSLNSTVTNAVMYNPTTGKEMVLFCASLVQASDGTLKEDIQDLPAATETVSQLRPVSYYWIADAQAPDRTRQHGLVAQEVQKIFPDAVAKSGRGTLAVNFSTIVTLLVKAMQEQQARLEALEAKGQGA